MVGAVREEEQKVLQREAVVLPKERGRKHSGLGGVGCEDPGRFKRWRNGCSVRKGAPGPERSAVKDHEGRGGSRPHEVGDGS